MNICLSANALGDPSVTLEQVTPVVIPSGPLFPPEVSSSLFLSILFLKPVHLYILPLIMYVHGRYIDMCMLGNGRKES